MTDIDHFSGYQSGAKEQKQEEKPEDPFELGPYDSEGNYRYTPKVKVETTPQN